MSAHLPNRGTVCTSAKINMLGPCFSSVGISQGGGWWGVRCPLPLPPQIRCFTLKIHAIQLPSSGLDVACGAAQLRTPSHSPALSPVIATDRPRAPRGVRVRSDDSRNQLLTPGALRASSMSTGQREFNSSASVNALAFLVIFFLLKVVCLSHGVT